MLWFLVLLAWLMLLKLHALGSPALPPRPTRRAVRAGRRVRAAERAAARLRLRVR